MGSSRRLAVALAALVAALPAAVRAGPGELSLSDAGGRAVPLAELVRAQEATVLVFWSAGCPCVRRYQERVDALLAAYPAGRVRVLGVVSNAGERFADALAAASKRGVRLPLFHDPGGQVAAALGARSTPTIAVLDAGGTLRFLGWLDNERKPREAGREPWLEQALAALLGGDATPRRTRTFGCPITRGLGDPSRRPCCSIPTEP